MIQEQKDLLLKDLSARLSYGVKFESENAERVYFIDTSDDEIYINGTNIEDVKPYLFPLSSMTDEQRLEIEILTNGTIGIDQDSLWDLTGYSELNIITTLELIQWLYKNHFDVYGLIEKGLAIDCTNLNIY